MILDHIRAKIPIWLPKGRNELSGNQCIWDWMKYNIRAHTIQYSKIIARETEKRKRKSLQDEYFKAKHIFETDPKIKLKICSNCFMKKK